MKSLAAAFLAFASLTFACYDDSLRCVNPNGSTEDDYTLTVNICNQLNGDICYCAGWFEDYCTVVDKAQFNATCVSNAGFAPRQCSYDNPLPPSASSPAECADGTCGSSPTEVVSITVPITVTQSVQ